MRQKQLLEKFPKEQGFVWVPGDAEHLSESAAKIFHLSILKICKKLPVVVVALFAYLTVPLSENRWTVGTFILICAPGHGGKLYGEKGHGVPELHQHVCTPRMPSQVSSEKCSLPSLNSLSQKKITESSAGIFPSATKDFALGYFVVTAAEAANNCHVTQDPSCLHAADLWGHLSALAPLVPVPGSYLQCAVGIPWICLCQLYFQNNPETTLRCKIHIWVGLSNKVVSTCFLRSSLCPAPGQDKPMANVLPVISAPYPSWWADLAQQLICRGETTS